MKISKVKINNINKKIIAGLLTISIVSTPFVFIKLNKKISKEISYIDINEDYVIPKKKQKRMFKTK